MGMQNSGSWHGILKIEWPQGPQSRPPGLTFARSNDIKTFVMTHLEAQLGRTDYSLLLAISRNDGAELRKRATGTRDSNLSLVNIVRGDAALYTA